MQGGVQLPQYQHVFKQVRVRLSKQSEIGLLIHELIDQQVSNPSQVITSGGQLIHANVLAKPLTLQTITTSAGGTQQIITASSPSSIISVATTGGTYVASPQGVAHARLISVNQTQAGTAPKQTLMGSLARPGAPIESGVGISLHNVTLMQTNPVFTQAAASASGVTASALSAAQRVSF